MVQYTLRGEDIHEAEVHPVHRDRPGQRPQRVQAPDLPEPPAGVARLVQQRERKPARRAQVPPPLLRNPLEDTPPRPPPAASPAPDRAPAPGTESSLSPPPPGRWSGSGCPRALLPIA